MSTQQTAGTLPAGAVLERRTTADAPAKGQRAAEQDELALAFPNGPAAAAILSAGLGCFLLGLFATLGDAFKPVSQFFTFYRPTGALSGVTTTAIAIWLVSWFLLSVLWGKANVRMVAVNMIAFLFLALGLLLTFPPFMDFLQGK